METTERHADEATGGPRKVREPTTRDMRRWLEREYRDELYAMAIRSERTGWAFED
jgi:hypothetical protein